MLNRYKTIYMKDNEIELIPLFQVDYEDLTKLNEKQLAIVWVHSEGTRKEQVMKYLEQKYKW